MIRFGDIVIFQPGKVPADRRLKSNFNIHSVALSAEIQANNILAEKRLARLCGM